MFYWAKQLPRKSASMSSGRPPVDPFQKHRQLRRGQVYTLPSFAAGQTNRPRSRRLENRHAPSIPPDDLQQIAAPTAEDEQMPGVEDPQSRTFSVCAASVLKPRRISVTPAASQIRALLGTGIMRKPFNHRHDCRQRRGPLDQDAPSVRQGDINALCRAAAP